MIFRRTAHNVASLPSNTPCWSGPRCEIASVMRSATPLLAPLLRRVNPAIPHIYVKIPVPEQEPVQKVLICVEYTTTALAPVTSRPQNASLFIAIPHPPKCLLSGTPSALVDSSSHHRSVAFQAGCPLGRPHSWGHSSSAPSRQNASGVSQPIPPRSSSVAWNSLR